MIRIRKHSKSCIAFLLAVIMLLSMAGCGTKSELTESANDASAATEVSEAPSVEESAPVETPNATVPVEETKVADESTNTQATETAPIETPAETVSTADKEESFSSEPESSSPTETTDKITSEESTVTEPLQTPGATTTSAPSVTADTSLDDELSELAEMDTNELTPTQRNAINMLNYMTVLTQEINDSSYEIIYVVIGDDGMPAHEPWRLGHLFELAEGEDLLHNNRFSIESDSYSVTAKPIEQKQ